MYVCHIACVYVTFDYHKQIRCTIQCCHNDENNNNINYNYYYESNASDSRLVRYYNVSIVFVSTQAIHNAAATDTHTYIHTYIH